MFFQIRKAQKLQIGVASESTNVCESCINIFTRCLMLQSNLDIIAIALLQLVQYSDGTPFPKLMVHTLCREKTQSFGFKYSGWVDCWNKYGYKCNHARCARVQHRAYLCTGLHLRITGLVQHSTARQSNLLPKLVRILWMHFVFSPDSLSSVLRFPQKRQPRGSIVYLNNLWLKHRAAILAHLVFLVINRD